MIVDADGVILGRLASKVAKELLKGNQITIINTEKVVVSGNPKASVRRFFEKRKRGDPRKGPFYPKYPERIMRRVIRGMLPYKKDKGRKALKRLKVYRDSHNIKGEKISKTSEKLRAKYTTLGEICKELGAKL